MSAITDAVKGVKQLLLLQEQVRQLEATSRRQGNFANRTADDLIALDKRVVRIEAMIEMSGRGQPRIDR